jgi:hypothetical protein
MEASRDNNRISTLVVESSVNGTDVMKVYATTGFGNRLLCEDDTGGTDVSEQPGKRDGNFVPVLMAVSSLDGVTPVAVYGNPVTGALLIQST